MSLLHYLSYVGAAAAFIFVTLSLASGLLWLSELIEEHSRTAKLVGQRGIYAIIILHIVLYFFDSLPFWHVLFSIVCHLIYLRNFTARWPFISLSSWSFIASCFVVVIDHFMWFFHFAHVTQEARQRSRSVYRGPQANNVPGFADIATFFGVCVWLAPLFLFLSLSANDNALPMNLGSTDVPSTPTKVSTPMIQKPKGSLFKSFYDALSLDSIPRLRSIRRRDSTQGIIAPPSPNIRPSSPLPSPNPLRRTPSAASLHPPIGSPRRRPSGDSPAPPYSGYLSPNSRDGMQSPEALSPFVLGSPPRRVSAPGIPLRRSTVDGRLEMRRAASSGSSSGFRLDEDS
ncbi:unnamed protein product [Somion occarium]|uniref:DUF396-domain-containing protein n=1 Tax=Somion occarium TaxID=3059160 RepID=A0ABP1CZV7_9APHY